MTERKEWSQQSKSERLETLINYRDRLQRRLDFLTSQWESMGAGRQANRVKDQMWGVKEKLEKLAPRIEWYST